MSSVPLPVTTGKELKQFLLRIGYDLIRIDGSHHHFKKIDGTGYKITVPIHGNSEIKPKTLNNIIFYIAKNENLTVEDVRRLLSNF